MLRETIDHKKNTKHHTFPNNEVCSKMNKNSIRMDKDLQLS